MLLNTLFPSGVDLFLLDNEPKLEPSQRIEFREDDVEFFPERCHLRSNYRVSRIFACLWPLPELNIDDLYVSRDVGENVYQRLRGMNRWLLRETIFVEN